MRKIQLMGHIVAGFPNFEASLQAARGICEGGASFLEVQFPFSDPSADGVVIESACIAALNGGFTTPQGFLFLKELSAANVANSVNSKLFIMSYANILFSYGIEKFVKEAKSVGVSGFIVPDLSLQNDEGLFSLANKYDLQNIALIAPATPNSRIPKLAQKSGELVYVVARSGITGEKQTQFSDEFYKYIARIKKYCKKPLAVGFGIENKEQIKALSKVAQIAVVGSAFSRKIAELAKQNAPQSAYFTQMCDFTKELLEN